MKKQGRNRGRVNQFEKDERDKLISQWGVDVKTMVVTICSVMDLKQSALAYMLGVDQASISTYIHGGLPRVSILREIKKIYDKCSNNKAPDNLRDWIEHVGALRDGARIAWGSSPVTWRVCFGMSAYIINDDTEDVIGLGACASLPSEGWRVLD